MSITILSTILDSVISTSCKRCHIHIYIYGFKGWKLNNYVTYDIKFGIINVTLQKQ